VSSTPRESAEGIDETAIRGSIPTCKGQASTLATFTAAEVDDDIRYVGGRSGPSCAKLQRRESDTLGGLERDILAQDSMRSVRIMAILRASEHKIE